MKMERVLGVVVVLIIGAALSLPLMAQQGGGGGPGAGGGDQGGGRGRGGFDPAQFRKMIEDRMKQQLGVNDDEWKALQPKVEKVTTLQRDMRGGFGGFGRGRGGDNPGGDNVQLSAVQEKARELRTVLENKDAKPDEIKAKLTAYREAKVKAAEDLKKARADLTELLTLRQEAVLVEMGILE